VKKGGYRISTNVKEEEEPYSLVLKGENSDLEDLKEEEVKVVEQPSP
jgi:hypothetical protein